MGCTQSQEKSFLSGDCAKKPPTGLVITAHNDRSDEHFSHEQKQLLRETWQYLARDKQKHGIAIFQHIFAREPITKYLFPFRELEGEQLLSNSLFRSHAMRFMNAVECTIVHLDALDLALVPILHRLGEKHVYMPGFKQQYFSAFMGSIMDVVAEELGDKCTEKVKEAWGHLGNFVAAKMMEGYQSERSANGVTNNQNERSTNEVTANQSEQSYNGVTANQNEQSSNGVIANQTERSANGVRANNSKLSPNGVIANPSELSSNGVTDNSVSNGHVGSSIMPTTVPHGDRKN